MKKGLAIVLGFAAVSSIYAAPIFAWGTNVTGSTTDGFDFAIGCKSDSSGNVYTVSNVYNGASPTETQDIVVVKLNPSGTAVLWGQTINLYGFDDRAYDMEVDAAGNVYVCGFTAKDDFLTDTNIIVRKYNPSGTLLWAYERTPPANNKDEYAYDLEVSATGEVYVVGEAPGPTVNQFDFSAAVIKLTNTGAFSWIQTRESGFDYDAWTSCELMPNGNLAVTGELATAALDSADAGLSTYSSTGTLGLNLSYNIAAGTSYDRGEKIVADSANNLYLCGYSLDALTPVVKGPAWARKVTSAGATVNTFSLATTGRNEARDIVVDGSQNAFIAVSTMTGTTESTFNINTYRMNSSFVQTHSATYNGPGNDEDVAASIAIDGEGNVVVCGTVDKDATATALDRDVALRVYSPSNLTLVTTLLYNNVSDWDYAENMRVGNDGSLLIAGNTYVNLINSNAMVVKYGSLANISPFNFQIVTGLYFGGNVASLQASDDDYLFILNDENDQNAEVRFFGTSTTAAPSQIRCRFETSATRSDLSQFTDAFNFNTNAWVNFNLRSSTIADDSYNFLLTGTLANFVGPANEVRTRIRYIPQADLEAADGWAEQIDLVRWEIL